MSADPYINGQRIYYIRSAVEAIATKLGIELNFYGEPAGDGDDPALAAPSVQADALTGADQVPDVVHARHEQVVGHSRHAAPRDIRSYAGGPATTPALDRTARAEYQDFTTNRVAEFDDLDESAQEDWRRSARRHLSAALHDPKDRHWLGRVLGDHRLIGGKCRCGFNPRLDYFRYEQHLADALLAVILGARGEEGDRG
jgi:hypothetical protein